LGLRKLLSPHLIPWSGNLLPRLWLSIDAE
jgi:hypothetical protein